MTIKTTIITIRNYAIKFLYAFYMRTIGALILLTGLAIYWLGKKLLGDKKDGKRK